MITCTEKESSRAETSVGESSSSSSSSSTSSSIMPFIPNSNNAIKSNSNESLSLPTQHQNPFVGRFLPRDNSSSNNSNNNNEASSSSVTIGRGNVNSKDDGYDRYRLVVELELKMEYALALAKIKTKIMRAVLVREQNASKLRMVSHAHYDDNNEKKRGGRDGVDVARNDGCRSSIGSKRIATEISCARRNKWQQDQQQQQEQKKKTIVAITTATAIGNNMEGVHNINNSSDDIIENSSSSSSSSNNGDTSYNLSADTIDGKTTVTPVTKTMGKRTRIEDATQSVRAAASVVVGQLYDHNDNINERDGDNDWREMGDEYYNRADDCLLF